MREAARRAGQSPSAWYIFSPAISPAPGGMTEPSSIRILVVDDEPEIRALLRKLFEREGFSVIEAATGTEMMAEVSSQPVSLVTLDLGLGGEDGLELARRVRARNNVPIVMITGKGDTIDRVVGLELGADDYIAKPFHLREVLARVRAVLRRYGQATGPETSTDPATAAPASPQSAGDQAAPARLAFADWVLDIPRRELACASTGSLRDLTTAEFNLLEVFIARPGRVLSRDNLMDLLKGHEWTPLDRTIDNLVARLRKKIEGEAVESPRLIKTVRGVGYVFTADIRRV